MVAKCVLCKGKLEFYCNASDYKTGDGFVVRRCSVCGILHNLPRPGAKKLFARYYKGYRKKSGKRFIAVLDFFVRKIYLGRAGYILKLLEGKEGKILDIGCGGGTELEFLLKKGWDVLATERSKEALAALRKKGIPAVNKEVWQIRDKGFEVVVLRQSLEHLYHPLKVLGAVETLLKNKGFLLIATPNSQSFECQIFNKYWFHLDPPRHLYIFSRKQLVGVIENMGFKLINQSFLSPEYDFFGFIQSSLNVFYGKPNFLYSVLLGKKLKLKDYFMLLLQLPLILLSSFLSLFIVPVLAVFRSSGTMVLLFQKQ